MSQIPDGGPEHLGLLRRLEGSFVSSSHSILSITQGVVLAALAAAVSGHYARFSLAQWIMAIVTFGVLILVWTQITIDTLTWVQVPDFQGALVPFLVGALELFLAAAITIDATLWLFGVAAVAAFSSIGLVLFSRFAKGAPENATLLVQVRGMRRTAHVYNAVGIVLSVFVAIGSLTGWLGGLDAAVSLPGAAAALAALVPGLWLAGRLLRSFRYWRKIVAYARTGN